MMKVYFPWNVLILIPSGPKVYKLAILPLNQQNKRNFAQLHFDLNNARRATV